MSLVELVWDAVPLDSKSSFLVRSVLLQLQPEQPAQRLLEILPTSREAPIDTNTANMNRTIMIPECMLPAKYQGNRSRSRSRLISRSA
jgi:hypothetical protein